MHPILPHLHAHPVQARIFKRGEHSCSTTWRSKREGPRGQRALTSSNNTPSCHRLTGSASSARGGRRCHKLKRRTAQLAAPYSCSCWWHRQVSDPSVRPDVLPRMVRLCHSSGAVTPGQPRNAGPHPATTRNQPDRPARRNPGRISMSWLLTQRQGVPTSGLASCRRAPAPRNAAPRLAAACTPARVLRHVDMMQFQVRWMPLKSILSGPASMCCNIAAHFA